jgi:hypothetical protein
VISIGPDAALQFWETIATCVAALLPQVICVVSHGATGGADVVVVGWVWPPPLPLLCVVWSDVVVGNVPPVPFVVVPSVAVGSVVVVGVVVSAVVVVLVGVVSVPTVVVVSALVPGSVAGVVAVDVPSAASAPPVASPAARPVDNAASNTAMKTWVRFTKSSLLR